MKDYLGITGNDFLEQVKMYIKNSFGIPFETDLAPGLPRIP